MTDDNKQKQTPSWFPIDGLMKAIRALDELHAKRDFDSQTQGGVPGEDLL